MTDMRKPPNPRLVLLVALVLPGVGQVLNGQAVRGLMFLFFLVLLGTFTLVTAAPDVSAVGRYSGGLFVWAMAAFDAYKQARIRTTIWDHRAAHGTAGPAIPPGDRR